MSAPNTERTKILITRRIYPEALEILAGRDEIDYNDSDNLLETEELLSRAENAAAIMTPTTQKFNAELLSRFARLRIVANIGVGFDNVDIAATSELGIMVSNTPDVLTETTADFAFGLMLAVSRGIVEANRYLLEGRWTRGSIDFSRDATCITRSLESSDWGG